MLLAGALERADASLVTSFTGDFAPDNWTQVGASGNEISFVGNSSIVMTAPATGSYAYSLSITPSQDTAYTLSFSWQMEDNGDAGTPVAYYAVLAPGNVLVSGGTSFPLTGDGNSATVSALQIPAGDQLELTFSSATGDQSAKPPAVFSLVVAVPEAGTWLAAAFLGVMVTLTGLRRRFAGTTGRKA